MPEANLNMEAPKLAEMKSYRRKNASLSPSASPAKAQRTHLSLDEKITLMRLVIRHKNELVDRKTSEFYAKIAKIGYEQEGLAIHTESACRNQIISIMRVYEQRLAHRQPGMKTTPEEDELDRLCDAWKQRLGELQQYREKFLVGKRKCDCGNEEINAKLKKLTEEQQNVDMLIAKVNFLSKHLHDNEEKLVQITAKMDEVLAENKRLFHLIQQTELMPKPHFKPVEETDLHDTHPYGSPASVGVNLNAAMHGAMHPNISPNLSEH
ncbi:switch-activating protein Sap1 [Schizosaccharomyces japonicus yFS275]|uniref:Switch-activating protein Sap1 n=1 Tax=Schizosaccharomyces japonicus (strain yFS275 / FY16936) TaxID=402676 RepID=B6JV45_SCHJY|nr:switch-activating protein Sap1 [Schizosaccharomyces japonicus yFS275]EEB05246.2 switch-activating protein Sap1 [Schizosaccharomyces japonicus yFS275]